MIMNMLAVGIALWLDLNWTCALDLNWTCAFLRHDHEYACGTNLNNRFMLCFHLKKKNGQTQQQTVLVKLKMCPFC